MLDQMHMLRRLLHHANSLIVAFMPNVDDLVTFLDKTQHLAMHFAYQRAGGIDHMHAARRGLGFDRRRHAVGGKYDWDAGFGGGIGDLSQFLHEHRALRGQILDDMLVVHDLAAHIHRRQSVGTWRIGGFENRPHRQNRPIHAGAESARIRQHDAFAHVKPPSNRIHPSQQQSPILRHGRRQSTSAVFIRRISTRQTHPPPHRER